MSENSSDPFENARFTAEISKRMQVPDKILVSGGNSPVHSMNGDYKVNDLGLRVRDPRLDMQVPDRILVAGNNSHFASKSTPRELQFENAILPPTLDDVRVVTPPRSIRLDEHSFPTATDDDSEETESSSTPRRHPEEYRGRYGVTRAPSDSTTTAEVSEAQVRPDSNTSMMLDMYSGARESLTPTEELHLLRRQMAKLNHRLMAVELENQQQQQRELILTVLVSTYFIGKLVMWINRSL